MSPEGLEAMTLKTWIKEKIRFVRGEHLDEMLSDLREQTAKTKQRVDEIYHLTMNGEDKWFRQEKCNDRK